MRSEGESSHCARAENVELVYLYLVIVFRELLRKSNRVQNCKREKQWRSCGWDKNKKSVLRKLIENLTYIKTRRGKSALERAKL